MDRLFKIVPFMVLAFQALISTTVVQASDGEVVGYAEDGSDFPGSVESFPSPTVLIETSTAESDLPSQTDDPRPIQTETGKDGPSPGVIAGAVVGALAGVALIACALIIGFRMGRRHPTPDNENSGSKKTFRDTISSFPRPTIAWSRPNANETPERDLQNDVSVLQVNFTDDATAKRTSELPSPAQSPVNQVQSIPPPISPQPYSTTAVEAHRVELPTGLESQGWARSDAHPLPYEVDSQPQTHEVDGTPNNRISSP
ncbi:hypothetical protein Neosp_004373 [[Neocosmospora] mangrovei]